MKFGVTNREVIYNLKHAIADTGPISNETSYTNRELYFLLLRYRSRILAEKMRSRKFSLSRHNYQTIGCIPLEKADAVDCPCEEESGFTFVRTAIPIPKPIGKYSTVISIGNTYTYDFLEWDAVQDIKHSRFKSERNQGYYTMKTGKDGTYLYLYNDKHGESIAVTGIFENPLEVQNFPNCKTGKTNPCFSPMDQEFIIDPELLPIVIEMILVHKFKYKQPLSDVYNDDRDDTQNIRPPLK